MTHVTVNLCLTSDLPSVCCFDSLRDIMSVSVRKSRKIQAKTSQEWRVRQRGDMDGRGHAEEEEVVSEAQRQLKELLCRQMDTSTYTLQRTLQAADSMFTAPVTYQALEEGVAPLRSMQSFSSDQEVLGRYNDLRGAGLSEGEVQLAVLGDKPGGVMVEPQAMLTRRKAIQEKLSVHATRLEEDAGCSGVLGMSRHAWEVEQSLYRGSNGHHLQHLTTLSKTRSCRRAAAYPAHLLPGNDAEDEEYEGEEEKGEVEEGTVERKEREEDVVLALPLQLIQRNRLTTEQIRQLPRFKDYSPGSPSSVLYIKNLHRKVSLDDLHAIFGHWREGPWPELRLLTGKMGGQAFAHFQDVPTASQVLAEVNGYLVRGKPLIIAYSHHNT